jgi:hypothetical protein
MSPPPDANQDSRGLAAHFRELLEGESKALRPEWYKALLIKRQHKKNAKGKQVGRVIADGLLTTTAGELLVNFRDARFADQSTVKDYPAKTYTFILKEGMTDQDMLELLQEAFRFQKDVLTAAGIPFRDDSSQPPTS